MHNALPPFSASQSSAAASPATLGIDIHLSPRDGPSLVADAASRSAGALIYLDPRTVVLPDRPNRSPASFDTAEFEALCHSILSNGGNVTPILVRRREGKPDTYEDTYELVAGERRLRACVLAGVPVLAMLAVPDTESEDGLNRLRENTGRQELRPWEAGQQVRAVYEQFKPISGVELAARLGMSQAAISRALDISSLPDAMVDAFASPLEIQVEHVKQLKKAWARDADAVQLEVANIQEEREKLRQIPVKDVVRRITEAVDAATRPEALEPSPSPPSPTPQEQARQSHSPIVLACDGEPYGQLMRNANGGRALHIDSGMSVAQEDLLVQLIDAFIRHTVRGQPRQKMAVRQVRRGVIATPSSQNPAASSPRSQSDGQQATQATDGAPT